MEITGCFRFVFKGRTSNINEGHASYTHEKASLFSHPLRPFSRHHLLQKLERFASLCQSSCEFLDESLPFGPSKTVQVGSQLHHKSVCVFNSPSLYVHILYKYYTYIETLIYLLPRPIDRGPLPHLFPPRSAPCCQVSRAPQPLPARCPAALGGGALLAGLVPQRVVRNPTTSVEDDDAPRTPVLERSSAAGMRQVPRRPAEHSRGARRLGQSGRLDLNRPCILRDSH